MKTKRKKILKLNDREGFEIVEQEEARRSKLSGVQILAQESQIGFSVAVPICLEALFGKWLDDKFSTSPKLTLSFLFVGIVFGFLAIFNIVNEISKKRKQ